MKRTILTLIVLTIAAACQARTITVNADGTGDYPTVQAAVDDANDGDEVVLLPGTYTGDGNRDIDYLGKSITVRGTDPNDPNIVAATIIDCNGSESEEHRGFILTNRMAWSAPVLEGLTIINGWSDFSGGAILCAGGRPTIKKCHIRNNNAYYGGGIGFGYDYTAGSVTTVSECIIADNIAASGGGIGSFYSPSHFEPSKLRITHCTITGNSAWGLVVGGGGGINCSGFNAKILYCTISNNSAAYGGGILCSTDGWLVPQCVIAGCVLTGNSATYRHGGGGAIACRLYTGLVMITHCDIINNSSAGDGAGIAAGGYSSGMVGISDCNVVSNSAAQCGGGISSSSLAANIERCSIINNHAGEDGGGIFAAGNRSNRVDMKSCVLENNTAKSGSGGGIYLQGRGRFRSFSLTANDNTPAFCQSNVPPTDNIYNCTFCGNFAQSGGAIALAEGDFAPLENSILWDNRASAGPEIALFNSTLYSGYCNIKAGYTSIHADSSEIRWANGNIDQDPHFALPGYWDPNGTPDDANDDFWVNGNYRLSPASPCIDTGDPDYVPLPAEPDIDGNRRVINARVDMGAYESRPPVKVDMQLTPQKLNCKSKGKWIKAHITLPEELTAEDIDVNTPAVLEPADIESTCIDLLGSNNGPVHLEIVFDRENLCDALDDNGLIEIELWGRLVTGQYFYAADTIKVSNCE